MVNDGARPTSWRRAGGASPLVAWTLFVTGLFAVGYACLYRQPLTTSDFTLFYTSAHQAPQHMYDQPPGPPRGNLNPPQFQLLLRPLAALPLPVASAMFRMWGLASLCLSIWLIASESEEQWDVGDIGALLTWYPMVSVISLNQVTWVLWPPLIWASSCYGCSPRDAGARRPSRS